MPVGTTETVNRTAASATGSARRKGGRVAGRSGKAGHGAVWPPNGRRNLPSRYRPMRSSWRQYGPWPGHLSTPPRTARNWSSSRHHSHRPAHRGPPAGNGDARPGTLAPALTTGGRGETAAPERLRTRPHGCLAHGSASPVSASSSEKPGRRVCREAPESAGQGSRERLHPAAVFGQRSAR